MSNNAWQRPWVLPLGYSVAGMVIIASARDLLRAIAKTGSRDLPAKQTIFGDHCHSDDHAPHACRYCLSAETQPASPSDVPLAVFLRGPYCSEFLVLIENIIDMTKLVSPENSRYDRAGTAFPNGRLGAEVRHQSDNQLKFRLNGEKRPISDN